MENVTLYKYTDNTKITRSHGKKYNFTCTKTYKGTHASIRKMAIELLSVCRQYKVFQLAKM